MSRADRVAARLAEREVDLLLVTDPVNLRYLTGFTGTNGLAVVGPDTRRFVTDFRYMERAEAEIDGFAIERGPRDLVEGLGRALAGGRRAARLRGRARHRRPHRRLREVLPERIALVAAGGLVEAERAVKEPAELTAIRGAAALADDVYAWVLEQGLVGRTEREVALALEHHMRRRGAEDPSFPSIVAAARTAPSRTRAARRRDPAGTLVTLDLGARLDGYCSDCTRTWATGS